MAIINTKNGILFIDTSNGPVTSSLGSNVLNFNKIIGTLESTSDKAFQIRMPSGSIYAGNKDVIAYYVTQSGGDPRIGIGTPSPIGSLDIRTFNSNTPPNISLRTNQDGIINVGEETGKLRFLIESSSFNLDGLNLAISGSTAEIFSRVTEVDSSGVKGSLVFGLSKTSTTSSIDAFTIGYEVGSSELSDGDIHAVLSGSMELNAGVPKIILHKADGNQPIVQIGSVNTNDLNEGSIILRRASTTDNAHFVIRDSNNSYISSSNSSNFGIGTSSPSVPFHVVGDSLLEGVVDITGDLDMNNNSISNPSSIDQTVTDLTITLGSNDLNIDGNAINFNNSSIILDTGGHITASGDISASGNLYANLSDANGSYPNTVTYDTATGQFYYTGSYGGGSSLTVGGVAGAIQYSDGAGALDFDNTFKWSDTGVLYIGSFLKINILNDTNSALNQPTAIATGFKNNFQLSKGENRGIYANFEPLSSYFMLHPNHILGDIDTINTVSTIVSDDLLASSRFHVIDQYSKAHIAKIINLGDTGTNGKENLLLGTAHSNQSLSGIQDIPYHKFIDFQIKCGVHGGLSIAGIYYDPTDYLGGGGIQSSGTVKYQGILVSPSDKKLKKDITDTNRSIDDIMSMKVKDYRWKDNTEETKKSTGLIAQELQETHPELISNLDDTLNVNYTDIIPMLIKAVQDQQEEITNLKNQIKNIEK